MYQALNKMWTTFSWILITCSSSSEAKFYMCEELQVCHNHIQYERAVTEWSK